MQFRTEIEAKESTNNILLNQKLLLIGSCFSQEIGSFLAYHKFTTSINPLGIVFNPVSLEKMIDRIISKNPVLLTELTEQDGIFSHYDFHSSFNTTSASQYVQKINDTISAVSSYLSECDHIFITLGTAIVHSLIEKDSIVSNCHKMPKTLFRKSILNLQQITNSLQKINNALYALNKNISIHYTLSPVRHTREGLENNTISKSLLRTAIAETISENPNINYFPSYEIMIDDLRDYRYYKEDLIHPNKMAVSYIWQKFCDIYMSRELFSQVEIINKINKSVEHKAMLPTSEKHQNFLRDLIEKIKTTENTLGLDYSLEKEKVLAQIIS